MIVPRSTTRLIRQGVTTSLTLEVQNDDGVQQTATACTITIYDGNEEVVSEVAVDSLGPPASYSLLGSLTTDRPLSEDWLEIWRPTIGGTQYEFQVYAHLVRRLWYPTINDTDLTAAHRELSSLRPPGVTSYATQRNRAAERMQRDLVKRGKRPWLIIDTSMLYDPHVALSLGYIYLDWGTEFDNSRFKELADYYLDEYGRLMGQANFRYDSNEDGTANDAGTESASPGITFTMGAPYSPFTRSFR